MGPELILILLSLTVVNSDLNYVDLVQYESYAFPDLNIICSYLAYADVTEKCAKHLGIVCKNPTLLMTMLDASSKFPYSGLGYGSRMDFGNYDQCLTIDHEYKGGRILGEHCTYGLAIPDIQNISDTSKYFILSVCRPSGCFAEDYNSIVKQLLNLTLNVSLNLPQGPFLDIYCQTVESFTTYTAGDIVTLTIFSFVILLMIVSTVYDIFLYRKGLKPHHPLLLSFSVRSNGKKLLHVSKHSSSKEQIEVFHGFRVISMMWVVAGHGTASWPLLPVTNADTVINWQYNFSAVYITSAHLAVDTFFFMSGVVITFQYLKGRTKPLIAQVTSVPRMILHRYFRLTPAMLMIFLVLISMLAHLGSGPAWAPVAETFAAPCNKYWWSFFLYIQNYYNYEDMCLLPTWYLSADMQMFLITPLVLIPLSLQIKKFGINIPLMELLALNVFCTILPLVITLLIRNYDNEYDTHSRLINYFIGVTLGAFMRVNIEKPFLHMLHESKRSITNLVVWAVVLLGMLAVFLCYQEVDMNAGYDRTAIFIALMRPAWCIGLGWITYSCYHGYGGFVNWILCRPIFQILGRLTYCIYLLHTVVIACYFATTRTKQYFSDYIEGYLFCGHYVVSVILATFWTLAFESPLIIIEKHIFGLCEKPPERKPNHNADVEQTSKAALE